MSEDKESVEVIEGWLHVWEIDHLQEQNVFLEDYRPKPNWVPKYCVFTSNKGMFDFHDSEQYWSPDFFENSANVVRTRLDGGTGNFHRRWGYRKGRKPGKYSDTQPDPSDSEFDTTSLESFSHSNTPTDDAIDSFSDSSSDRASDRRESLPPVRNVNESMESIFTTFNLVNFFIKKGFRTSSKSSGKSERRRDGDRQTDRKSSASSMSEHDTSLVKGARSHESVLASPLGMHSVDLSAPNVEVKPLHSSVLGQGHFFHVATSQGSKYISCTTTEERDRWLSSLRRTIRPQDEHSRRSDSSLKIWILEAKNVNPKRRYFCDILLDQTLYAKTSVKSMTDILFWGEHFEFKTLPAVEFITVNLYREADKKKKKDKNILVGYLTLPLSEFENRQLIEKWITCKPVTGAKTGKDNKNEVPIIRLKARRQTVEILPLEYYQSFLQYLVKDYKQLCQMFEPLLAVREKEDFATCLVHILQKQGKACQFLADIVMEEISRLDDEHLTFRGNSISTKAMEAYMKLVGEKYLLGTLGDLIQQLVQSPDDCEVDPTKVSTPQLLACQQKNLDMYSNMAWVKVINSFCYFPNELRDVFASLRSHCEDRGKGNYSDNLISGCIFLRFLCPAILYPSLFNLTQEYPNERASRNLTLIAKTIQTLANFSQFGIKEDYMTFMNAFIEREAPNMKTFLQKISSREMSNQFLVFDGDIDLGKELSILYALLTDCTEKHSQVAGEQFENLTQILTSLTNAFDDPTAGHAKPHRKSQVYDNLQCMSMHIKDIPEPLPQVASTPAMLDSALQSPTDILIDMLYHCGESTDDIPALAERSKSFSNFQKAASGFNSLAPRSASESAKKLTGVKEARSISVCSPYRIYNEQTKQKSLVRMATVADDAYGDYVDLLALKDPSASSHQQKTDLATGQLHQPLGFANPLFQHQQQLNQSKQAVTEVGSIETYKGIAVSQAQTVQRSSSDSSSSSNEGREEEPWQVALLKTSSPLPALDSVDQNSPVAPPRKMFHLHSSGSDDSTNDQSFSSVNSSPFFSCSSDFTYSGSTSLTSPTPFEQDISSATSVIGNDAMNGCSTFPRRHRDRQESTKHSTNSANETISSSSKVDSTSSSGTHKSAVFHRQVSNPCQKNEHSAFGYFQSSSTVGANKTVSIQQRAFHEVKTSPAVLSSAAKNKSQNYHHSSPIRSSIIQPRNYNTSSLNHLASISTSSPSLYQHFDGSDKLENHIGIRPKSESVNSSLNSANSRPTNFKGVNQKQKPPASVAKSAGWQISHLAEKSHSFPETDSGNDSSSPQSVKMSLSNRISTIKDSDSVQSINSSASSSNVLDNKPSQSDSSSSFNSLPKPHQRVTTQNKPRGMINVSVISQNSNMSLNIDKNNKGCSASAQINNTNTYQTGQNMAAFNRRLNCTSDSKIHSLYSNSQPPAFLLSKYAVVRPHTKNPTIEPRSTRAASYHSPQEPTQRCPKPPLPYRPSNSLDLGYLGKEKGETIKARESISGQPSGFCQTFTDDKNIQSSSSVENSSASSKLSPQPAVHMGIGSVMRKLQEQETTKQEYEQEVHILRQQLLEAQERLQQTEMKLLDHEMDTHKLMDEWQQRLVDSEEKMRRQQAEKDEEMKNIIMRLHTVEEELKREHTEMLSTVEHKQQVIEVQEQRIQKLDQANRRLLQALASLKGRRASATDENSNSSTYNTVFETGEIAGFQTSSC